MAKRPSIAENLNKALSPEPVKAASPVEKTPQAKPNEGSSADKKSYVQPGRKNTKAIVAHFDPAVSKQLKQIALDNDTTSQALIGEALNDLFVKYGKSAIA